MRPVILDKVRVAAAQYDIVELTDWAAYESRIQTWVDRAVARSACLLVFPEYFSMELVSLFADSVRKSLPAQLDSLQVLHEPFRELFARLAAQHQIYIVAGSFPVRQPDNSYRNRSYLFGPQGCEGFQDKLQLTRFEKEQWPICGGDTIRCFDTAFGKIGINICYDAEFPMIARRQAEAGATLILVPSCTDTVAGYWRVRIGCQARALENQCYVVHASTVGEASWSIAVDINTGAAAVYTPIDRGFPLGGLLDIGTLDVAGWVVTDIQLTKTQKVRTNGQTFNYRDWPAQFDYKSDQC